MFDATLVLKRVILTEIFPSRKRDTMLIFPNMMNPQTKYSDERRMIQINNMC